MTHPWREEKWKRKKASPKQQTDPNAKYKKDKYKSQGGYIHTPIKELVMCKRD